MDRRTAVVSTGTGFAGILLAGCLGENASTEGADGSEADSNSDAVTSEEPDLNESAAETRDTNEADSTDANADDSADAESTESDETGSSGDDEAQSVAPDEVEEAIDTDADAPHEVIEAHGDDEEPTRHLGWIWNEGDGERTVGIAVSGTVSDDREVDLPPDAYVELVLGEADDVSITVESNGSMATVTAGGSGCSRTTVAVSGTGVRSRSYSTTC